jgi:hypothetical protein
MIEIALPDMHVSGTGRVAVRPGSWLLVSAHARGPRVMGMVESVRVYNPFPSSPLWLDVWAGCDPLPFQAEGVQIEGFGVGWAVSETRPRAQRHLMSIPVPPLTLADVGCTPANPGADGLLYACRMSGAAPAQLAAGELFVRRSGTKKVSGAEAARIMRRPGDAHDPQPGGSNVIQTQAPVPRPALKELPPWLQTPAPTLPGPPPRGPGSTALQTPATVAGDAEAPPQSECDGIDTCLYLAYRVVEVLDADAAARAGSPAPEGSP